MNRDKANGSTKNMSLRKLCFTKWVSASLLLLLCLPLFMFQGRIHALSRGPYFPTSGDFSYFFSDRETGKRIAFQNVLSTSNFCFNFSLNDNVYNVANLSRLDTGVLSNYRFFRGTLDDKPEGSEFNLRILALENGDCKLHFVQYVNKTHPVSFESQTRCNYNVHFAFPNHIEHPMTRATKNFTEFIAMQLMQVHSEKIEAAAVTPRPEYLVLNYTFSTKNYRLRIVSMASSWHYEINKYFAQFQTFPGIQLVLNRVETPTDFVAVPPPNVVGYTTVPVHPDDFRGNPWLYKSAFFEKDYSGLPAMQATKAIKAMNAAFRHLPEHPAQLSFVLTEHALHNREGFLLPSISESNGLYIWPARATILLSTSNRGHPPTEDDEYLTHMTYVAIYEILRTMGADPMPGSKTVMDESYNQMFAPRVLSAFTQANLYYAYKNFMEMGCILSLTDTQPCRALKLQ